MAKAARTAKLSKRTVDAARPEGDRFIVWDVDLPGFGLRVEPSGHKSFVARYRVGGGRAGVLRQTSVGRYGTVAVEEARVAARKLLGAAAGGSDPVGERRQARQSGRTIAEVCDWYLREAEAGRLLGRRGRPIKQSTIDLDRGRIEVHVKPLIGRSNVSSLSRKDMEAMQSDIAAGKTAAPLKKGRRPRGGIATGGGGAGARTLAMMRAILEHAVRHEIIESNPARGVQKIASGRRKFRLTLDQIRELGAAMSDAKAESRTGLAAIRLLLLTGFRRNEALGLKPGWIMPAGGIDFPDAKAGPQARPIGKSAMKLLNAEVARLGDDAEWIFPADRGEGHFVGLPKMLARLAKSAKIKGVTPHSLRHTFGSVAGDLGFSELTIAGLLGHTAGSVTSGYVHLDTALVTAADRVSGVIADALDGRPSAKVMPIRRKTG